MQISVRQKDPLALENSALVQQTPLWFDAKRRQGFEGSGFTIRGEVPLRDECHPFAPAAQPARDVLVIQQQLADDASIAYVPYGPQLVPEDGEKGSFLEQLSEGLRAKLPEDTVALRYDLPWESPWTSEQSGAEQHNASAQPNGLAPELQALRLNFGTEQKNLVPSSSGRLPSDTIILNLRPSEETLLARMKPKVRYNIRLAQRRGVTVRRGHVRDLDIWQSLYRETAARNGIRPHARRFFSTVLASSNSTQHIQLLIAEKQGRPLAALFLSRSANRATYLYGASSNYMRNAMGTYALQWEAIRLARSWGCESYDMFGVAPGPVPAHPLYGLYRFKAGFGGKMLHRMGCWDYPFQQEAYRRLRAHELGGQGYHL